MSPPQNEILKLPLDSDLFLTFLFKKKLNFNYLLVVVDMVGN